MFESATFDSRGVLPNQAPRWMLLTLAANLAIVAAMIVLPLIYPATLPDHLFHRILYAPSAAPASVAQTRSQSGQPATTRISFLNLHTDVQRLTPTGNATTSDPGPANSDGSAINMGDFVPGGVNTPQLFQTTKPVVRPTPLTKPTISQGVADGLLISKTTPAYPIIAKTMGVSGTVTLAATISKTGNIENLRILSGPVTLQHAAAEAVQQWRYRPYLLNNQPVEVETTINVVFSIAGH
jgi:periplasmic protein TonB